MAREEKEFKAEIIEECKQELLNHLAEVIYRQNDYPIRAVPQATILSLPALMKVQSEVNNWKKEFAWEWWKRAFRPDNPKDLVDAKIFFEKEWKEQENDTRTN